MSLPGPVRGRGGVGAGGVVPVEATRQGRRRRDHGLRGLTMTAAIPEGWSYGPWHDGPDPLAPPPDLRDALDEIGRDVMAGSSPRSALEELLRRGTRSTSGLDDLTRRLWERRAEIQRRHNLDGTLRDVQRLLEEALEAERRELFPNPSDDARFAEAQLDALPAGTAAAVRELASYDWQSSEA